MMFPSIYVPPDLLLHFAYLPAPQNRLLTYRYVFRVLSRYYILFRFLFFVLMGTARKSRIRVERQCSRLYLFFRMHIFLPASVIDQIQLIMSNESIISCSPTEHIIAANMKPFAEPSWSWNSP